VGKKYGKVLYVMHQSHHQGRVHYCHWPGCAEEVKPAFWGCRKHWYTLPVELRTKIWKAYKPGQEVKMNPSEEYLDAAEEVQRWIKQHLKSARPAAARDRRKKGAAGAKNTSRSTGSGITKGREPGSASRARKKPKEGKPGV
jgi:hypothetical protein